MVYLLDVLPLAVGCWLSLLSGSEVMNATEELAYRISGVILFAKSRKQASTWKLI